MVTNYQLFGAGQGYHGSQLSLFLDRAGLPLQSTALYLEQGGVTMVVNCLLFGKGYHSGPIFKTGQGYYGGHLGFPSQGRYLLSLSVVGVGQDVKGGLPQWDTDGTLKFIGVLTLSYFIHY